MLALLGAHHIFHVSRVRVNDLKCYILPTEYLYLLYVSRGNKWRVFENTVLRRIFGPKRDKVMGEWRRMHNEELNDLYSSPNIVRVIKSRTMNELDM